MNSIITAERHLTIRCRAFSGEGVKQNRIRVEADSVVDGVVTRGDVSVWDSVAGHFTTCHILSPRAIAKIRRTFQP